MYAEIGKMLTEIGKMRAEIWLQLWKIYCF